MISKMEASTLTPLKMEVPAPQVQISEQIETQQSENQGNIANQDHHVQPTENPPNAEKPILDDNVDADGNKSNFYNRNRNFKNRPFQKRKWVWIYCKACNVKSNNEYNHKLHLASQKHRDRAKQYEADELDDHNNNSPTSLATTTELKTVYARPIHIGPKPNYSKRVTFVEDDKSSRPFSNLRYIDVVFLMTMIYFGVCLIMYMFFTLFNL